MPINIVWEDDEKSILRMSYSGKWTLKEFDQSIQEALALYRSVSHDIDLIIDTRSNQTNILNTISSMARMESEVLPNHRSVTVIGVNPMLRAAAGIGSRIAPRLNKNLSFAATIEEAHAHILQMRARRSANLPIICE
ncbi:MAG: hypothetical protein IAE89_10645 [Anaerolineae bacterium]|nr:hypothetical protein [Anaerolineae bacterium]